MARRPPKMMAEMGTPWGFSNSGADAGAVLCRSGEAGVGVGSLGPSAVSGLQGSPFQFRACVGGILVQASPTTRCCRPGSCTTLVKMVPFLVDARALGLDFALVPGATPKKPFSGLMAHRRPSAPVTHPGDIVAHAPAPCSPSSDSPRAESSMARLVLPQAEGKAAVIYRTSPWGFSHAQDQHVLGHPALVAAQVGGDAQSEALLAQQDVAAVAGVDGHDGVVLRELNDIPLLRDPGSALAWRPLMNRSVAQGNPQAFVPTRVMMAMFSTT